MKWLTLLILFSPAIALAQPFVLNPIYGCIGSGSGSGGPDTLVMRTNISSPSEAELAVGSFSQSDSIGHTAFFYIDSVRGNGFSCNSQVSWPMRHGVNYGYFYIELAAHLSDTVVARLIGNQGSYYDSVILIGIVDTMPLPIPGKNVFWLSKKDFGILKEGDSSCGLLRIVNPATDTQVVTVELRPIFDRSFAFDSDVQSLTLPPGDSNTWLTFCYHANKNRRLAIDTLILKFQRIRQGEAFDTAFYYSAILTGRCEEQGFSIFPSSISLHCAVGVRDSAWLYLEKLVQDTLSVFLRVPVFTSFHFVGGTGDTSLFFSPTNDFDSVLLLYEPTLFPASYSDSVVITDGVVQHSVSIQGSADPPLFVSATLNSDSISIYPNPAWNRLALTISSVANESVKLTLRSILGQTVLSENIRITNGAETIPLHLPDLPSGEYVLTLEGEHMHQIGRITIVR